MKTFEPRLWQPPMIDHLGRHPRSALFAAMGSGKTAAVLTALSCVDLFDQGPILAIAPKRVARSVWPVEPEKWSHLSGMRVSPILGTAQQRTKALKNYGADMFTINYENIPWLVETLDGKWPFKTVVADEATRLKGYRTRQGTQRARALSRVIHRDVDRYVALTGTPAPNGLRDLWGQLWFIDQGKRLGRTYTAFEQRWFYRDLHTEKILPFPHSQEQISAAIEDVCLTVDPKDYLDIADPIVNVIPVELPPSARTAYDHLEKKFWVDIEGEMIDALNAAGKSNKCLQAANGAIYPEANNQRFIKLHDEKLDALESVIEEAAGMPVLVAYQYRSDLARLKARFPQGRELDTNPQTITDWNEGRIPLMFVHPASAGHGLDLQYGSNILCYFSIGWNLEEHDQVLERIGPLRQYQAGLDRPVFVHYILARNTIDRLVYQRQQSKRSVQSILLDAMKERPQ